MFVPRANGGQTVAWRGDGFVGSATVYPARAMNPRTPGSCSTGSTRTATKR